MEIKWLKDFLVLSVEGNFRIAAQQCHVSQPAFSRRIQALETWIGAPLIDRNSHPSQLTEAGKLFLPVAQKIIDLAEMGKAEVQTQVQDENEKITFATLGTLAQGFLPTWLKKLQPLIEIQHFEVRTEYSNIVEYFSALEEEEVDFFICYENAAAKLHENDNDFTSIKLGEETLIPVVSPDENGAPKWWLPDASTNIIPTLHSLPKSSPWPIMSHIEERYGNVNFKCVYNSSLGPTLRAMAIEGFGLAWIPNAIVKEDIANARLVRAAEPEDDILVDIMIYRCLKNSEPRVEKFWNILK